MADQLVQKIVKAYADLDGLTLEECKSINLNEQQCEALCEAFADGYIEDDEVEKITASGFSPQLITTLNASKALQKRVKWLVEIGHNKRDVVMRSKAADVLVEIGPAAVKPLIKVLYGQDDYVRFLAINALVKIGSGAVPALLNELKNSESNVVRVHVARALGKIGPVTNDVVPALIAALEDPDNYLRKTAAEALGEIGPAAKDAVPSLIAALKDPNVKVRREVVWALGKIGPSAKAAIPSLFAMLKYQVEDVFSSHINTAAVSDEGEIEDEVKYLCFDVSKAISKIYPAAARFMYIKKADVEIAEKTIGAEGALLLRKEFGIERFNRYHPSILKHLVKMASDVNHDRRKPLILALVAEYDDSDVFYWGKNFEYDPRIRLVVIEAGSRKMLKESAWKIRDTYGIPDEVFITAHGEWDRIALGDTWLTNGEVAEDFKGFFGDKRGHVTINACDAGAPAPGDKKDFAQMAAHGFNAETAAARAVEGLIDLQVEITDEGQARLVPTYFELGAEFFGINHGGMKFYPDQEPVHERVADVNNGLQPGIALNIADEEWHVGASFGYSHQLSHRLRFRYDLLTDLGMNDHMGSRVLFSPEIAVGLSNHLMFATGAMGGVEFDLEEGTQQPVIQQYSAFKLVLPAVNTELDLGYANTVDPEEGIRPSFFSRLQGRFDISETSSR